MQGSRDNKLLRTKREKLGNELGLKPFAAVGGVHASHLSLGQSANPVLLAGLFVSRADCKRFLLAPTVGPTALQAHHVYCLPLACVSL